MIQKLWMIVFVGTFSVASDLEIDKAFSFRHDPYKGVAYQFSPALLELRQEVIGGSAEAVQKIYNMSCCYRKTIVGFVGLERRALENLISNGALPYLHIYERERLIKAIVVSLSAAQQQETLNGYDSQGQTFAHKMTPVHWRTSLLQFLIDRGLDVTAQTIVPDRYPGSTLAHNVAGLFRFGNACNNDRDRYDRAMSCLRLLWCVDSGKHFECRSFANRRKSYTVFGLIPFVNREEVVKKVQASE